MSKRAQSAALALTVDAWLAAGNKITVIDADWRSRPRQKITRMARRPMPMWQRLAIACRSV